MRTLSARRLAFMAVLTALALALSYMEQWIPLQLLIPLPGVKLGLANIVTVFALYAWGFWPALTILIARCFLGALFGGGLTAFFFSLLGGCLAMSTMGLVSRCKGLSIFGVSICGAAAHNIGQILAAMIVLKSTLVISYLPPLLLISIFTGILTGTVAAGTLRALWAAKLSI